MDTAFCGMPDLSAVSSLGSICYCWEENERIQRANEAQMLMWRERSRLKDESGEGNENVHVMYYHGSFQTTVNPSVKIQTVISHPLQVLSSS